MGKRARGRSKNKVKIAQAGSFPSPPPYKVELTATAKRVYRAWYKDAREADERGDPTNAKCTLFRMVDEAVEKIIPQDPINRQYALTRELSNIFRLHKGRVRICWIASSEQRKVSVLFISESLRKEGDANDPYRAFTKMLMSGEFDSEFTKMKVRKPTQR